MDERKERAQWSRKGGRIVAGEDIRTERRGFRKLGTKGALFSISVDLPSDLLS